MKRIKIKRIRYSDLNIFQTQEVIKILKKNLPYLELDFSGNWPTVAGKGGSSADFTEISISTLLDLITDTLYNSK